MAKNVRTYKETLGYLYHNLPMYQRTGKAAYKANLDNTIKLDIALGHPHKSFKSIHIAGTNGKGSVSHILASVLQSNGYKTGLYTSPHLLDFRERIRVNGKPITENAVVSFVDSIQDTIEEINPSFFEITVAMAFDYFKKCKVDVAVVETGLGGRLDSTNIITPELSIITNISMDHTEFLGDSLEKIAAEKAGIIKAGVPIVIGTEKTEVLPVLKSFAEKNGSQAFVSSESREFSFQTETLDHKAKVRFHKKEGGDGERGRIGDGEIEEWEIDLLGSYQRENLSTSLLAIDILTQKAWKFSQQQTKSGLSSVIKNTGIRGRWEILAANPKIICDTAHNEEGIRKVMQQLISVPAKKLHIIWGMVSDKSLGLILPLLPKEAAYYFTAASIPRAMDPAQLAEKARASGLLGDIYSDVKSAIMAARENADQEDVIFIGGSTFVVADALEFNVTMG
jgi:dihydrofolate synthase / folylpolyglutamate synthase